MICPYCNKKIQDDAKACPLCGKSFVYSTSTESTPSIRKQAAQQELDKITPFSLYGSLILTFVGLGIIIYSVFTKGSSIYLCIVGIFMTVLSFGYYAEQQNVKVGMESILDNKKRTAICPNCKSPAIKQRFVKDSTVRGKSRTRVSKNINPARPFTYRNYDREPSTSYNKYKTTYYCQVCGAVFDRPQIFEYK